MKSQPAPWCQPVRLTAAGRDIHLLRLEGRGVPDAYATQAKPAALHLATADGFDEVLRLAASLGLRARRQRALAIDLDAMEAALAHLHRSPFIAERAAKAVLDGWHALDDLCRTMGVESACPTGIPDHGLRGLYDRFFCANTFPEKVFGPGRRLPELRDEELALLRAALRGNWQQVSDRASEIPPPPWRPLATAHSTAARAVAATATLLQAA